MFNYSFFQRFPLSLSSLFVTNIKMFKICPFFVMIKESASLLL